MLNQYAFSERSVIKRATDSTMSTTSGQTDTTSRQMSTTNGQTSTTNGDEYCEWANEY